jgi:tetratricopeptide (TPR) repeat protein
MNADSLISSVAFHLYLRHAKYYLTCLLHANVIYSVNKQKAIRTIKKVASQLRYAIIWLTNNEGNQREILQLQSDYAIAGRLLLEYIIDYPLVISVYEKAITAARILNDYPKEADHCEVLAYLYLKSCKYEKSIQYSSAQYNISCKLNDIAGKANSLNSLGIAYKSLSKYEEALKCCQEAHLHYKSIGGHAAEAVLLCTIGTIYAIVGPDEEAIRYYNLSIDRCMKDNNIEYLAQASLNLGYLLKQKGKMQEAMRYLKYAISYFQKDKNYVFMINCMKNMGDIFHVQQKYDQANNIFWKALDIAYKEKIKEEQCAVYCKIANVELVKRNIELAIKIYKRMHDLSTEIQMKRYAGYALSGLFKSYMDSGDINSAIPYYHSAMKIFQEIDDRRELANLIYNSGYYSLAIGNMDEAEKCFMSALSILDNIEHKPLEAHLYRLLGEIMMERKEWHDAIKYNIISYEISIDMRSDEMIIRPLLNCAICYDKINNYNQAENCIKAALRAAKIYKSKSISTIKDLAKQLNIKIEMNKDQ